MIETIIAEYELGAEVLRIAFGGDDIAFATADQTILASSPAFDGWRLLGYTDEGVLLGTSFAGTIRNQMPCCSGRSTAS